MTNKIYIVGAGPGNPDLLTVKAHRVLMDADIVLHDALMGTEILDMLPSDCQKVYAGKTYQDQQSQDERMTRIQKLMKEGFDDGKKVVRLKTGDPLIFGRGIEEIRFLIKENIDFELIPGITAGMAAANHFNIPVTERTINRTLLFCTGTTLNGDIKQFDSISYMIKQGTPVMIYMGLNNIEKIIEKFIDNGVPNETTICAVSKVSFEDEKMVKGTLTDFSKKLEASPLEKPTIIMVGENIEPLCKNI